MGETYITIGHTKKTHGAQGEIKVTVQDEYLEAFLNSEVVFLLIQGKPAPFFIENIRDAGDLLLKLEAIDSSSDAKSITSSPVLLREKDLLAADPAFEAPIEFSTYEGYLLSDQTLGDIGTIEAIESYPQQDMAIVRRTDGSVVLIPLHPKLLVKTEEKSRRIMLDLPGGILDL